MKKALQRLHDSPWLWLLISTLNICDVVRLSINGQTISYLDVIYIFCSVILLCILYFVNQSTIHAELFQMAQERLEALGQRIVPPLVEGRSIRQVKPLNTQPRPDFPVIKS